MARRTPAPTPQPANLSAEEMRAAIPKLERRIADLKALDVGSIQDRSDPRFDAVEQKTEQTLVDIFGTDSLEFSKYGRIRLDRASINMNGTPLHEIREGFRDGIAAITSRLQTFIDLFTERLEDSGATPSARAVRAFGDLDLHKEIDSAVHALFENAHYANAVEDACKVLEALVKMRSGQHELSGKTLMTTVFSVNTPILRFSKLQTQSDRDEQQGMMHLFAGAMLALRNPRAHEVIEDDPEEALEYIGFLSMLAKSLDRTTRA